MWILGGEPSSFRPSIAAGARRHLDPWRKGSYLGTIVGAVLLVTMTALITGVNASKGWRSAILGGLTLAMLPLFGSDQSR
jgi:hypothetical protein